MRQLVKVTVGHGRKVHLARMDEKGNVWSTLCRSEHCSTGYRRRSGLRIYYYNDPVTCQKCLDRQAALEKSTGGPT